MEEDPADTADPRYHTSLPVDENHNFPHGLLSEEDINLILESVTEGDKGLIAALNAGIPMAPYTLDALCNMRTIHRFVKVRKILEPAICFAVSCAHYYNGKRILQEATVKRRNLFAAPDMQRLSIGLHRLYRAAQTEENPEEILEAVEDFDLPQGAYEKHLKTIYAVLAAVNVDVAATTAELDYTRLGVFNYLFDAPRFLTQQAIETYAQNLADITRLNRARSPVALTVFNRTKDFTAVANDIMFSLALGNATVKHHAALLSLRKALVMKLSLLCELGYVAYLQVPETKDIYRELFHRAHEIVTAPPSEPPDFGPSIATLLRFARALMSADVCIAPSYITGQILGLNVRMYGMEGMAAGDDDDLEIEGDPSGPYGVLEFLANNPFTDRNLFKCPRDLTSNLGGRMIKCQMVHSLLTEASDTALTFDRFALEAVIDLVTEGAARQLKITPTQLRHYMEVVSDATAEGADEMAGEEQERVEEDRDQENEDEDEDEDAADMDLFANVEVRQIRTHRSPRTARYANVLGGRPHSVHERRRRGGGAETNTGGRETFL